MRAMIHRRALLATTLLPLPALAQSGDAVRSDRAAFRLTTLATGLEHPWGAALLPDGRLLVTERPGRIRVVTLAGQVSNPLAGVPEVEARAQGGMLDIALAPDFARTREVYLSHAMLVQGGALTRLIRARLSADATALEAVTPILDATPAQASGRNHYGSRIAFGPDGRLYLSTGDRMNDKMRSQRLDDLAGKVLRLERDGSPAAGNPFLGRAEARAEIFSYGHRNPQGLAFNPWTGSLWQAEFGARGGDEVNIVRPGLNYGWPIVSHGVDYNGSAIGTGQKVAEGIEAPLHFWTPSVSPSGIGFYTGGAFPGWSRSLFVAALSPPGLVRLQTEGDRVVAEERLLFDRRIRMRQIVVAADGALLVLTDEGRGRILRLSPA